MCRALLLATTILYCATVISATTSDPSVTSCHDQDVNPYIHFATKTAYRVNQNKDESKVQFDGCEAQQFWLMSRHGTRNPGTNDMKKLKKELPNFVKEIKFNFKAGKATLCEEDVLNLEEWKFLSNVNEDKFLVKEGFFELKGIGYRFQKRFPSLLTRPWANESYIFQFTDSERTDISAQAFAKGMFGKDDAKNIYMKKSQSPDLLLRFYKSCDKWKKEVDENKTAIIEKTKYEESDEFLTMMRRVFVRLGYVMPDKISITDSHENITYFDRIDMMYSMCSFDKAWRPRDLSPWCAVFSQEDLEILEFREDLEYYYEDGYGFPINYEQACPPLVDLYTRFREKMKNKASGPKGVFYFTHSGTILKVFARLGFFNDSIPPTHTNRLKVTQRAWKTSLIDSFASNVAFVLFKCTEDYYVAAYVQEKLVRFPGCQTDICRFQEFTYLYGNIVETCKHDDTCRL